MDDTSSLLRVFTSLNCQLNLLSTVKTEVTDYAGLLAMGCWMNELNVFCDKDTTWYEKHRQNYTYSISGILCRSITCIRAQKPRRSLPNSSMHQWMKLSSSWGHEVKPCSKTSVQTDWCCPGSQTNSHRPEIAGDPCVTCLTLLTTSGVLCLK